MRNISIMNVVRPHKLWKRAILVLLFGIPVLTFLLYIFLEKSSYYIEEINYSEYDEFIINIPPKVFEGERFVHLDLKGAPPKISYYQDLFPLLAKLGATGLLIEYEDMFPYTGELLQHVPAHNAYSHNNIDHINFLASENNLTVIPLVQTFGHLEFVLKLKQFSFLREVPQYPQVICPTHNMTLNILYEMINQIIKAHPRSKAIHIGADEVYNIGICDKCKHIMLEEGITGRQMFLNHIKRIATKIKTKHPDIKILMWDDEFRTITEEELIRNAIGSLVEPVIWKYTQNVLQDLSSYQFIKYAKVFKSLWFASAFKGATGSGEYITPVLHHIANHQSWMRVYHKYKNKVSVTGIFITGWQRYDHFSVLCELLPVGIPSLALSLGVIQGIYPGKSYDLLQCKDSHVIENTVLAGLPGCQYPGSEILDGAVALHQLNKRYGYLKEQSSFQGWMADYNRNHNFSNPQHVESILNDLTVIMNELTSISIALAYNMSKVYDNYTVSEWQESFIKPVRDDVQEMMESANNMLSINDWPRRPL